MKFCLWHDWSVFNEPDKSNFFKRNSHGSPTFKFYHNNVYIGTTSNVKKVSDLVCYKCDSKKMNLTNVLERHEKNALRKKARELKKQKKQERTAQKAEDIKKRKLEAISFARKQLGKVK